MFNILILDKLYEPMLELIKQQTPPGCRIIQADPPGESCAGQLAEADVIMTISARVDRALLEQAKKLKLVHLWGVGFEKIDVAACKEKGVPVARTTGANSVSVAEHTIMLMLAVYRKLIKADRLLHDGVWPRYELRMNSFELLRKRVGLVGFGQIGQHVAQRLKGFETETYFYDVFKPSPERQAQLGVKGFLELGELISTCDVISLHCPLTGETNKLFNAAAFKSMKSTAILINTSRGAVVDEAALFNALESGEILGAGLDVFDPEPPVADNPLMRLENVILTPHLASATRDTSAGLARVVMENVVSIIEGRTIDPYYLI